jgi:hypothetical protein
MEKRSATRLVASWFGVAAGLAGIEHGYFEVLQGNVRPDSLMIASMGPPCDPEQVWNACEPAMTVIPSFLGTGILAMIAGLAVLIWAAAFVQRKYGGIVLILLSIALLLVGGGLFPPLIGIIAGVAGTRINAPLSRKAGHLSGRILSVLARSWPWPLVIFLVWLLGQWIVGYFFNDFLRENGYLSLLLIIALLPLSVFAAYAHDMQDRDRAVVE